MPDINRRTFLTVSGAALGGIATGTTVTAATRTDRFIVQTKGRGGLRGLDVVHEMPGVKFAVVRGSEKQLKRSKRVKDFAPDVEIELNEPETNTRAPTFDEADASDYEGQPGDFLQWDKDDLDVPEAHETTEGEGTRVAVIDSGVLETHPDLAGPLNVGLSRNFTDDGGDHNPVGGDDHGTHVAGIVAADNGGGIGVNGTAPKTDLVDCRVFSGAGASFGDVVAAVVYSANIDADVANLSLGAYPVPRQGLGQFYGSFLNSAMTYANKEGTLLVIAAGNDSADLQHDGNVISLPNEGAQAVSVSATGPIGYGWDESPYAQPEPPQSPAFYTNYGTNAVTLGAPGGDASLAAIAEDNDDDDGDGEPDPGGPEDPLWYYDLVFNTVFSPTGTLVSGTFGPSTQDYPGDVTAERTGEDLGHVTVQGTPPYTTDSVPWYSSVGFGGVEFAASKDTFDGDETVTVDYETGEDHERPAPDWISIYVTVPPESEDGDPTDYVVVDWQVSASSGSSISRTAGDSFGDGPGGVFEASNIVEILSDPNIDPSSPNASESDVVGTAEVTGVGVFSGGGIGRDDSVDITYTGVAFEGEDLLIPQAPGYGWKAGTSMAAPNVAGAAALVKSANPNYNANQVEAALKRAADVPSGYDKTFYGSGYLNILDAL
jgi:subtilisin family serine protease